MPNTKARAIRLLSICWLMASSACTGQLDRGASSSPDEPSGMEERPPRPSPGAAPGTKDPPGTPVAPPAAVEAGPSPLRRLSHGEYNNTLADILGLTGDPAGSFAADVPGPAGFPQGGPVGGPDFERLVEVMELAARDVAADRLAALAPCDVARAGEEGCADVFIKAVGRRLFRHPLSAQEAADLKAVYNDARRTIGQTHDEAIRTVLFAMLMSPRFHYHWELGDRAPIVRAGLVAFDPYELASRLSYLLWQSAPDDELLAAAERGELATAVGVMAQARRLVADPGKGGRAMRGFVEAWAGLEELDRKADESDTAVLKTLRESLLRAAEDLVGAADRESRTFARLMTSTEGYVNEATAKVWGVDAATVKGAELRRVSLPGSLRAGVLTHPAFLAAHHDSALSTPVRRGRFVFEKVASCLALPPPIADIPDPPERKPNESVRSLLDAYTNTGACAACHANMNPYGFALGAFDRMGALREKDDYGQPIDTRARVPDIGGSPAEVTDAADLARKIAASSGARACFTQQVYKYALRRVVDSGKDPGVVDLDARFVAAGNDLRELFLATTQLSGFYYRTPAKDEVLK